MSYERRKFRQKGRFLDHKEKDMPQSRKEKLQGFLRELVEEEREAQVKDFTDDALAWNGSEWLDAFRSSKQFSELYEEAVERDIYGKRELEDLFAGGMFAQLGYRYMVTRERGNGIVLSPKATFEIWKKLYPYAKVVAGPFGSTSLMGVSVPDGVQVDEQTMQIIGGYEYSLFPQASKYIEQHRNFLHQTTHHPWLFVNPNFTAVTTERGRNNLIDLDERPFSAIGNCVSGAKFGRFFEEVTEATARHLERSSVIVDLGQLA